MNHLFFFSTGCLSRQSPRQRLTTTKATKARSSRKQKGAWPQKGLPWQLGFWPRVRSSASRHPGSYRRRRLAPRTPQAAAVSLVFALIVCSTDLLRYRCERVTCPGSPGAGRQMLMPDAHLTALVAAGLWPCSGHARRHSRRCRSATSSWLCSSAPAWLPRLPGAGHRRRSAEYHPALFVAGVVGRGQPVHAPFLALTGSRSSSLQGPSRPHSQPAGPTP
jgi:hypothetical protein